MKKLQTTKQARLFQQPQNRESTSHTFLPTRIYHFIHITKIYTVSAATSTILWFLRLLAGHLQRRAGNPRGRPKHDNLSPSGVSLVRYRHYTLVTATSDCRRCVRTLPLFQCRRFLYLSTRHYIFRLAVQAPNLPHYRH